MTGTIGEREIIVLAVLPWNSADAMPERRERTGDNQDLIDMCLSCQKSKCCNCIGGGVNGSFGRKPMEVDLDTLKELLDLHRRTPEICAALKVSERTLYRLKKKLKAGEQKPPAIHYF